VLAQPILRWLTDAESLVRFERSYAHRVTTYTQKIADLIKARTIDPGEWVEEYAYFCRRVLDDAGDWMSGRDPNLGRPEAVVPFYSARLTRSEGLASVNMRIPPFAFAGLRGSDPTVNLVADDFLVLGGGANLSRSHIAFAPERVHRSDPQAQLKIFDVRNAVRRGNVYRGIVRTQGQERCVGLVQVEVR
jgi:hypothetical protein